MPFCRGAVLPEIGFETAVVGPFREGAPIYLDVLVEDGPCAIENYFLSVEIHEEAFRVAGFRDVLLASANAVAGESFCLWT